MKMMLSDKAAQTGIKQVFQQHPYVGVLLILACCIWIAVYAGAVPITFQDWNIAALFDTDKTLSSGAYVLWNLRIPRILLAMLVGAAMALSGALAQGLFRNPLADPGLLGVTSGAACMAAFSIVILANLDIGIPFQWRYWILPVSAFIGAVGVCLALDRIARWITANSISGLLLTGIALNALAAAFIGLCTYLSTDEQLRSLTFWTMGSLAGANWTIASLMCVFLLIAFMRVRKIMQTMNALALGEAAASHVGVDIRRLRSTVIILIALLCGFSVAWCGMIGFIGLIAPHIVRTVIGPDQRYVIPLSMPTGALLLLVADTISRTVAIPAEIPVGIFTALLGAPFFLMLLIGARHRGI